MSVWGNSIVLRVGDIGYRIFPVGFVSEVGQKLAVHIHDFIREDRHELYAFTQPRALDLFEKLIGISGVGPHLAQKILASGDVAKLEASIMKGDIGFLTSISGVGKKRAQKIILELKGVLVSLDGENVEDQDTLEVLLSLGYDRKDCVEILPRLTRETPEDRVKEALQLLSR